MNTGIRQNRFRLRNPRLKSKDTAKRLAEKFSSVKGVRKVEANLFVGSFLVIFEPTETTLRTILGTVREDAGVDCTSWLTSHQRRPTQRKRLRRMTKLGLAASLAGTIGTLALSGRSHAIAGSVLFCFIAAHSFHHRQTLLR